MIKNAIIYTPDDPVLFNAYDLRDPDMQDAMFERECPDDLMSQQLEASGWVPSFDGKFISTIDQLHAVRLKKLEKKLPQAAVKRKVSEKAKKHEAETGYPPGRNEMQQFREVVLYEMLPDAPIVESYINAYFDERSRTFLILTSKESDAELMLEHLRQIATDIDSPLKLKRWMGDNIINKLTHMVTGESDIFVDDLRDWHVGDNCKLEEPLHGGKASFTGSEPLLDQVQEHIDNGMIVTELGLEIPDTVTFKVDSDLKVKSVKFGMKVEDEIVDREDEDQFYERSTFIIQAATMRTITNGLKNLFDITT